MIKAFQVFIDDTYNRTVQQIILDLPKPTENDEFDSIHSKSLERLPFEKSLVRHWNYQELTLGRVKISDLTIEDYILLQTTLSGGNNHEQN